MLAAPKVCWVQYKPLVKVMAVDAQLFGVPRKYQLLAALLELLDDATELELDEVVPPLPPHAGQGTPTAAPAWKATASCVLTEKVALPDASTVIEAPLQAPVL